MQTARTRVTETHAVSLEAGLVLQGAILESRDEAERKAEEALPPPPRAIAGHRPAA